MRRTLLTVLLAAVLVLAGGVWWLYNSMDSLVASAIRSYGPEITGVVVRVGGVNILPTDNTASIQNLQMGNPAGFKTERALFVGNISMKLDVASLTKDLVLVREISIDQPEVTYEYAAQGSNLDVIQRHVEAYIAEKTGSSDASSKTGSKKKVIIEHLYIKGAQAKVSADTLLGKSVTLAMADLHLTDIGKKSNGVSPAEATRQIVSAITKNATKSVAPLKLSGALESTKKGLSAAGEAIKDMFK